MRSKLLQVQPPRAYVVVFDKEEEVISGLTAFAIDQLLVSSHFTAIGGFCDVTLGYFDRDHKAYQPIPLDEQVEVLSMVGNIADDQGRPRVHAHVVVGRSDGTACGGHLLEAHVWPTLELVVEDEPEQLRRRTDAETGLPLIDTSM